MQCDTTVLLQWSDLKKNKPPPLKPIDHCFSVIQNNFFCYIFSEQR